VGVRACKRRPSTRLSQSWTRWGRSRTRTARSSCSSCATTSRCGRPTCRSATGPCRPRGARASQAFWVAGWAPCGAQSCGVIGAERAPEVGPRSARLLRPWREAAMQLEAGQGRAALVLAASALIWRPLSQPVPATLSRAGLSGGCGARGQRVLPCAGGLHSAVLQPVSCSPGATVTATESRHYARKKGCSSDAALDAGCACGRPVEALRCS
jgi:hypothetical protein